MSSKTARVVIAACLGAIAFMLGWVTYMTLTIPPVTTSLPLMRVNMADLEDSWTNGPYSDATALAGQYVSVIGDKAAAQCTLGLPWQLDDGTTAYTIAAHCLEGQQTATVVDRDDASIVIGQARTVREGLDLAVVTLTSPAGTWLNTTRHGSGAPGADSVPLQAQEPLSEGTRVCLKGSTTGMTCGWRVDRTESTFQLQGGTSGSGAVALGRGDLCASPGDSGGPVFTTGATGIQPSGIILASSRKELAGPLLPATCAVIFMPVSVIAEALGGHPLVTRA